MAKKKKSVQADRYLVQLPLETRARVEVLVVMLQSEMPVKMTVTASAAVAAAVDEAIARRERTDGQPQS